MDDSTNLGNKEIFPLKEEEILQRLANLKKDIFAQTSKCIVGQEDVLEKIILSLLVGGHCILVGLPGLAKTLLISSISRIFNLSFSRIQFTPDLMPSDIIGAEIIEEDSSGKKNFRFIKGPVFANIILADEINRTPPKTQSALLEAMQENAVTIYGKTYKLDYPFFVFATQNPIEQEGTYTLPEAQLDRFLFNIHIGYPEPTDEIKIAEKKTFYPEIDKIDSILDKNTLLQLQKFVESVPISNSMVSYAVNIVKNTRPESSNIPLIKTNVRYGASPRASQHIVIASKACAVLNGRFAVNKEDVQKVSFPILNHRIILNFSAYSENITTNQIISSVIESVK